MVDELPDLDALFDSIRVAEESLQEEAAHEVTAAEPPRRVRPGKEAQRLYRDLARRAHPDLSTDPAEQHRRSAFIARVNEAYARGAAEELEALAEEWSTAPETAPDLQAPDRGEWLRQRLEWLTGKITELATEQVRLEGTAMGSLLRLSPQDPDRLLEELAEQLLARARRAAGRAGAAARGADGIGGIDGVGGLGVGRGRRGIGRVRTSGQ